MLTSWVFHCICRKKKDDFSDEDSFSLSSKVEKLSLNDASLTDYVGVV